MEIRISGNPKEIADLVREIQNRQDIQINTAINPTVVSKAIRDMNAAYTGSKTD